MPIAVIIILGFIIVLSVVLIFIISEDTSLLIKERRLCNITSTSLLVLLAGLFLWIFLACIFTSRTYEDQPLDNVQVIMKETEDTSNISNIPVKRLHLVVIEDKPAGTILVRSIDITKQLNGYPSKLPKTIKLYKPNDYYLGLRFSLSDDINNYKVVFNDD